MNLFSRCAFALSFFVIGAAHAQAPGRASITLTDQQRARNVPVELYFPTPTADCTGKPRYACATEPLPR